MTASTSSVFAAPPVFEMPPAREEEQEYEEESDYENDEKIERELRIRDKFREHNNRPSFIGKSFWSNIRLIIIFMILLSIFYYLFLHLDDVMVSITGSK